MQSSAATFCIHSEILAINFPHGWNQFFSTDSLLSFQWKVQVDVHEDALIADRGEVDCTPASTPNQPDIIIASFLQRFSLSKFGKKRMMQQEHTQPTRYHHCIFWKWNMFLLSLYIWNRGGCIQPTKYHHCMCFKNFIDFCFTFSQHLQDGMTSHTTSKISLLHCSTIHLLNFSFWIFQSRFVSWDAFYKDLLLYIWTSSTFPSTFVSWEAALIADKRTMHCTHAF